MTEIEFMQTIKDLLTKMINEDNVYIDEFKSNHDLNTHSINWRITLNEENH